jgi:rod shape determining protein RodA
MADIIPKFFHAKGETVAGRWLGRLDWSLMAAALGLASLGLLFVFSASAHEGRGTALLVRQGMAMGVGVAGMTLLALLPYQVFQTYARPVYIAGMLLLAAVLVGGTRLRGSRSWFNLGIFYFQPVELSRMAIAVALSAYAEARWREMGRAQAVIGPVLLAGLPLGMILLQPDLSSALSIAPMTLAVLFASGAPVGTLAALVGTGVLALGIPLASTYAAIVPPAIDAGAVSRFFRSVFDDRVIFAAFWGAVALSVMIGWWFLRRFRVFVSRASLVATLAVVLSGVAGSFVVEKAIKPYQRKRLIAFLDPAVDPLGAGYNIRQSQITLGSGRFVGKGYLAGSQSQLGFLPEKHTDFIFSLIGEELGFAGAISVLGVYFWIVFRALDIASTARDRFGRYLAAALGAYFGFTGLVNIGMVMGLMPVTGVPLPFLSYGGSGLVGSFLAIGLLQSIHSRRYIL